MDKDHPNWKSGSGTIPKNVLHQVPETLETLKARVRKVFDLFDTDQNGFLDVNEFQELAFALGENISKEQAQSYVDELDTNKDGKVSFEEFFSWWQKKDIATEQHKPTGLGVLKARLQSQPLMRSVTNLMGKLKEKREAEQSPDEGKVDIRISVGNLDNAPASIILNYTKIPPIEGTPVIGLVFLTKPNPDMTLLDHIKANFTHLLTSNAQVRELFMSPQFHLQPGEGARQTFIIELPFSLMNPATMMLGMGLEVMQLKSLSCGIRVSQRVSELNVLSPICAELFFRLSANRQTVQVITEQVQSQGPFQIQNPIQSGVGGLKGFRSLVFHVDFDDMSDFFRSLIPPSIPLEALTINGLQSLLLDFFAKGLQSTGANPDLELRFREAIFDSIDFLDEWKSIYLRAGCHQFSLDCTGLDVFKILPNRQVLNYPRQVTLAKSFNEKYRITASTVPVTTPLEEETWLTAESVSDNSEVLVKRVSKTKDVTDEISFFRTLNHANLLSLIDSMSDEDYQYMVFKYEPDFLQLESVLAKRRFSESEAKYVIKQLVSLLEFLHSKKVVSRDIKPEAFIYNEKTGVIKMITLKNAVNRTPITDSVGANSYSAPEVFFDTEYDAACDLWSLGMLAYRLLTGRYAFTGTNVTEVLAQMRQLKYDKTNPEWRGLNKNAQNFIEKLLVLRKQRLTLDQVKKHVWLSSNV